MSTRKHKRILVREAFAVCPSSETRIDLTDIESAHSRQYNSITGRLVTGRLLLEDSGPHGIIFVCVVVTAGMVILLRNLGLNMSCL
jgi:hypothetical protein